MTAQFPPLNTGALGRSAQAGGFNWGVDCKVNPVAFVGQERTFQLQLFRMRKDYTMENLVVTVEE